MPRFLAKLLGVPAAYAPPPLVNRAKPGPSRRARERAAIIAKMREMRFAMRMEFK